MKENSILLGLAAATLATLAVFAGMTASAAAPSQPSQAVDQAVRLLGDAFVKAYNAGDAKGVAALFIADGEIVNQAQESVQGQKAIEKTFGEVFRNQPKAKMAATTESVRVVSPTTAVEDGTSTVTLPNGQVVERNRYMVVYTKQDGAWRMATARDLPNRQGSAVSDIKDLGWLVGDWVDETNGATVVTSYRMGEDGHSMTSDFRVQIGGKPAMAGTQWIAWDPHEGKVRSWMHDTEGGYSEGLWTRDGDRWVVKLNGATHDGQVASSTNVLTRVGKDRLTWQSHDRIVGNDVMPNVEPITIVRKAPAPQ
jgi:uncharacterized protein (TIGR02246 family)